MKKKIDMLARLAAEQAAERKLDQKKALKDGT
jgi:hypothetical protein